MRFFKQTSFISLAAFCFTLSYGATKPKIMVSIPPQKTFVQAIAGEEVDVMVLLKPSQSPNTFSLTPRLLAGAMQAEVYFLMGIPMEEPIIAKLQRQTHSIQFIDTSLGIRKRSIEDHSHGHLENDSPHPHITDPHIWLSPGLVIVQLQHYYRALKELLPDKEELLNKNLSGFRRFLRETDEKLSQMLKPFAGNTVFVYHPAFGYFLNRYGLRQETVEIRGKQPSPKQLQYLIRSIKVHNAKIIFVQPQFDRKSAKAIADSIGGTVMGIDPLAENYVENLLHMGESISKSF